jgi:hypothetical protein
MKKIIKITNLTHKLKLLYLIKQNNLRYIIFLIIMNEIFILKTLGSLLSSLDIQNKLGN